MKSLEKYSKCLDVIASVITVALMIFLTVLIFAAVFWRFVLNHPIDWQYEVTLVCLSWIVFIGMSITFEAKEHLALTFISNKLQGKTRVAWLNAIDIICIAFLIVGIISSIPIVQSTWDSLYMTIPVKKGLFYMAFPIGAFFSIIHLAYHIASRSTAPSTPMSAGEGNAHLNGKVE